MPRCALSVFSARLRVAAIRRPSAEDYSEWNLMQARKALLAWACAVAALVALALILFWNDLAGNAGPSTTPTPTTPTPASTATSQPTASASQPLGEEAAAVAEAQARYHSAMSAVDRARHDPRRIDTQMLIAAGNADPWLAGVIDDLVFDRDTNTYNVGSFRVVSLRVTAVELSGQQPSIQLDVCGDNSGRYSIDRKTNKRIPKSPKSITHPRFAAVMVKATVVGVNGGKSTWFVKENKVVGKC